MGGSGKRGGERGAVTWSESDDLFRVQMCSPPTNELDAHVLWRLSAALDAFARSSAGVLLIGSGVPEFFATSVAPDHVATDPNHCQNTWAGLDEVCDRLLNADRPSIAVVEGFALDGGLKLVMACTTRVGTVDAHLGMPKSEVGMITGQHAHEIGLLDRLAEPGQIGYEALKLAAALTSPFGPAVTELLLRVDEAFDPSAERRENHQQQTNSLLEGPGARGRLQAFLGLRHGKRE